MIMEARTLKMTNRKGEVRHLTVRRCVPEEAGDILALQEQVSGRITDPGLFVKTTAEELRESMTEDLCIGVFGSGELLGFTLVVAGRHSPRNLGTHLGYDRDRCRRTVTYDTTFLHPAVRGFGLQQRLVGIKNEFAAGIGAEEALASVSPDNPHSYRNLTEAGFRVVRDTRLYGGLRRYILSLPIRGEGYEI